MNGNPLLETHLVTKYQYLGKGRFQQQKNKKMFGFIHSGWLAEVSRGLKSKINKYCLKKKYKDHQTCLIHPEN